MSLNTKTVKTPLLLFILLVGGNSLADTPLGGLSRSSEQIFADVLAEVRRDGERFANYGEETQLRHRVNEQSPDQAKKARYQHQERTMHKYQYQGSGQAHGQRVSQSGSMSRRSGGGRR